MTHFDRASLDRLLPATPGASDWEDVMSRSAALHSHRRRRLVMFGAAALVAVVGTASAIGSVREFFLDRGFTGLPPIGATSSAPETGELIVWGEGFTGKAPSGGHEKDFVRVWVYADGRVIWDRRRRCSQPCAPERAIPESANEFISGYLEQRLTSEGTELVRSAVVELFDRSRPLVDSIAVENHLLAATPGGSALLIPRGSDGSDWGAMAIPDVDRLARLQWRPVEDAVGANLQKLHGTIATPEQLSALRRVEALLTEPASALPSGAWAVREIRAYVPSHYAVCIDTSPPKEASHVLSLLPPRAADLLRDKSRTERASDLVEAREVGRGVAIGRAVTYCFKVETEEARDVVDAVSGLDPEPGWGDVGLAYRVAEPVGNLDPTRIWFEPYFPHGQFTFSGPFG